MRKVSTTLSVFVLLALLLTACGGQQTSTNIPSTNVPRVTVESTSTTSAEMTTTPEGGSLTTTPGVPVTGVENPSRLLNELKFSVVDQSGNKLGDVNDMVLDIDNTRVSYVVMGSGGSLDIGDKKVLIPWDSLKLQTGTSSTTTGSAQNAFVLQADPGVLKNAPAVDLNSVMPAMGQAAGNWDTDIQNYWLRGGSTAAGTPAASASTTTASTPAVSSTSTSTTGTAAGSGTTAVSTATTTAGSSSGTGTGNSNGQGLGLGHVLPLQGVMLASKVLGTTISLNPGQAQGQGQGAATAVATSTTGSGVSATATPAVSSTSTSTTGTGSGPAAVSTATTAAGSSSGTGTGNQGNGLGNLQATIDDMIIETNTGMIQYLVLKTSFGSGDILIPVPINFIQWDTTNHAFVLNVSASTLQTAPNFTEDQFPDTTTSGWDQQFSTFWQSNSGNSSGSGTSSTSGAGTGATATATP